MSWLTNLIRPDLRELAAYSSARSEAEGFMPDIAIDANESPWPPFGSLASSCLLNRYPEPQPHLLLQRFADYYGAKTDNFLVGRGSDDCIDVLIRLFCRAGTDSILICPPTFGAYKVYASIQGAKVQSVPLRQDNYQLDVPAITQACTAETKLIFIPSPNAPMGHLMKREDILSLLELRKEKSLIIVDEAYVEFTDQPYGMIEDLRKHPNLVILRTMSKAHSLAGERVGCAIASSDIVSQLRKVIAPYPLTQTSVKAALDALSPNGIIAGRERRQILVSERERMLKLLPRSPWIVNVFPSVANYILVQTKDAKSFMGHLRKFGILPRDRHNDISNTVRLSLGTPEENSNVLRALDVVLSKEDVPISNRLYSRHRGTKETSIDVTVNLDAPHFLRVESGIGFFDHMLSQLATHGGFGLELHCRGDLHIDQHHTIEDCALALGEALKGALGDKRGIARFGFSAPLDEALATVVIDLSGRPYSAFVGTLLAPTVGEMSSEMVPHFFHSLAVAMGAAIHITVHGENTHHMVEASFKATGRALRQAFAREAGNVIPSTKGVL